MKEKPKNELQFGKSHLFTSFMNDFADTACYCIITAKISFGVSVIYEELLEDLGEKLDIYQQLSLIKSGMFTINLMVSHIANSFEFYLESVVKDVITQIPEKMLDNDGLDQSIKPSMTYDQMIKAHLSGDLNANFIAQSYISRFKGGDSYMKFIRYVERLCNDKIISAADIKKIRWIYELRNHITHDGGLVDINKMHKSPFDSFELTNQSIPNIAIFEISHFLLMICHRLEITLKFKMKNLNGYTYEFTPMFQSFDKATDLSDEIVDKIDGGKKYYARAVEKARKDRES